MNATTYRATRSQLRIQVGIFAGFACLTVVAAVVAVLNLNHGHLTGDSGGAIFWGSIPAFVSVAVATTLVGRTTVDDHGIRVLRAWGRRSIAWTEIADIDVIEESARGGVASSRVRISPVVGRPFKVPVPIHSYPYSGDPEFSQKVEAIRARWQAATGVLPERSVGAQ